MSNDTLLAIPFFTFMGLVLERSGMAEDLLDTIGHLFGTVRGGLAYAVVFVGALLAATTGVVAASVISMGLISLPIMLRYGYDRRVASGVIAASGTLAQIIPPSLVLIVMADQLGRSVGDMYEGAFIPGIALAGLYAGYVFIVTLVAPNAVPGLPAEAVGFREPDGRRGLNVARRACDRQRIVRLDNDAEFRNSWCRFRRAIHVLQHPLRVFHRRNQLAHQPLRRLPLPLAHCSTDHLRDGAAVIPDLFGSRHDLHRRRDADRRRRDGCEWRADSGRLKRRLTWDLVRQAVESTAKLSAFVVFILIGARVFSLTFYGVSGHIWVEKLLTSLPGGQVGFLIFVNAFVFVLAFFLDFFELAFIVIPLLGPAAEHLGIDLIWFGVILGVNMQTSFMHPPFGFALFYLRSVAPRDSFH